MRYFIASYSSLLSTSDHFSQPVQLKYYYYDYDDDDDDDDYYYYYYSDSYCYGTSSSSRRSSSSSATSINFDSRVSNPTPSIVCHGGDGYAN